MTLEQEQLDTFISPSGGCFVSVCQQFESNRRKEKKMAFLYQQGHVRGFGVNFLLAYDAFVEGWPDINSNIPAAAPAGLLSLSLK